MSTDPKLIGSEMLDAKRGERSFREGAPWPDYSEDDRQAMAFWLGYHMARAREFFARRKTMELLGVSDD